MNKILPINRFPTKEEAAAAAGEALNDLLVQSKTQPILLLLSGGSALEILDYVSPSSLGDNLAITVLDERFTPLEASAKSATVADGNLALTGLSQVPEISNFLQLQKTQFCTDALEAAASFFGTLPRNGESMENLAARWESALKKWRSDFPKGKIIATLGMGADGHTAGIFPFPEDVPKFRGLFERNAWVAPYNTGNKSQYNERITVTVTFLKLIDEAIIFACGEEKKEKFDMVLSKSSALAELPALAWHELKRARIFTDIV